MNKSFGEQAYSGLAVAGRVKAYVSAVFSLIIGVFLFALGIRMIIKKQVYTMKNIGKIVGDPVCSKKQSQTNKNGVTITKDIYTCKIKVSYSINDKSYSKDFTKVGMSTSYKKDDQIDVYYNPTNPNDFQLTSDNSKLLGWIFITISFFIIVSSLLIVWMFNKSKVLAAAGGGQVVYDMFIDSR